MTTTTKNTKTGTFLWAELTFPEEIYVRLWGIMSNKNIFFCFQLSKAKCNYIFQELGTENCNPNLENFTLQSKQFFLQAPQQKPKKLISKSFSINFARLNLQNQCPVEVAIHVAALEVRELFRQLQLGGHYRVMKSEVICSQCRIPCRVSQGYSTKHTLTLLLEEVYITKSTEKIQVQNDQKDSKDQGQNEQTNLPYHSMTVRMQTVVTYCIPQDISTPNACMPVPPSV